MTTLSTARKIYKNSTGEAATYEEAARGWALFFAASIDEKYSAMCEMMERARLHAQVNSSHPIAPGEIAFFESLRATGVLATTWEEAAPILEQSISYIRPFYFHFFGGGFKCIDWNHEATLSAFAAFCEEVLREHVLIPLWWEQSGLSFSDLAETGIAP